MSILLKTDEASGFDVLSILEIKQFLSKNKTEYKTFGTQISELRQDLITQLGDDVFQRIYCSLEYRCLYDSNYVVFLGIDRAKKDKKMTAEELDSLNYKRFLSKKLLQNKFFVNPLKEIKLGYQ